MTHHDTTATISRLRRLVSHTYEGGYNGTCWECPYASAPLDRYGQEVPFHEVANDPTEAYFRCSLPTRPNEVEWGEYAPCTAFEWAQAHLPDIDLGLSPYQQEHAEYVIEAVFAALLDRLGNGSSTEVAL